MSGYVPQIQKFGALAAQDVSWRMGRTFQQMKLDASQCRQLADTVEQTSQKYSEDVVGLRDHADTDVMRECLAALEKYGRGVKGVEKGWITDIFHFL